MLVALQEVRAFPKQLPPEITDSRLACQFFSCETARLQWCSHSSRTTPSKVETSLGDARFDDEGRFIVAHFGLSVASIYFPKGNGKERDNPRVAYKMDFYRAAFERHRLRRRGRVYVLGDFNTAHHEIDLARPKGNQKPAAFCLWSGRC